ncbi:unnamed protein product [Lampetra fluviatilis]
MGAARGGAAGDGAERRMEQEDGDVSPEQAEQEAAAIYCGDCISREAREGGSRSRRRQQRRAPPPPLKAAAIAKALRAEPARLVGGTLNSTHSFSAAPALTAAFFSGASPYIGADSL